MALDSIQVTEKGNVENDISFCDMLESVDKFISCEQCDLSNYKWKNCPMMEKKSGAPACSDYILLLRNLRPHYQGIRVLMNMVYDITKIFKRIDMLNRSFLTCQYKSLLEVLTYMT